MQRMWSHTHTNQWCCLRTEEQTGKEMNDLGRRTVSEYVWNSAFQKTWKWKNQWKKGSGVGIDSDSEHTIFSQSKEFGGGTM